MNKTKIATMLSAFALFFTTFAKYPTCFLMFGEPEELLEEK